MRPNFGHLPWQNKELIGASHTFSPGRGAPLDSTPSPAGTTIRRATAAVGAFTGELCNSLSFYKQKDDSVRNMTADVAIM
jgi:hypothetical protein